VKKSQLSDKQLEDLLGQMPKIKDHRDSRDIYQNIAHRAEKRRKMPTWVIPGAALAAVLFLAFILSPGLLGNNLTGQQSMDSSFSKGDKSSMNTATSDDSAKKSAVEQGNRLMGDTTNKKINTEEFAAMDKANPYAGLISVYPDELSSKSSQIFTFAIPDQQAMAIVPVSVIRPKDKGKSWIDNYIEIMPKLTEAEWGLTDYYPINANWKYDEATSKLTMDVKQDHPYRYGSAAEVNFVDSMTDNFTDVGIEKLLLTTEGEPGIELGNFGLMKEIPLNAEATKRRAYLFLKVQGLTNPYLVPTKDQHKSIDEAFAQMETGDEKGYLAPSLPDNFKFAQSVTKDKVLELTLSDETKLKEDFMPNLEAILMTASEFEYKGVRFTNPNIDQLGPFNLKEVLPVPLAPNKKVVRE